MDTKSMSGDFRLIPNHKIYWEFIRNLRNNPQVKKGFINQEDISKEQHQQYMEIYGEFFYIGLYKEQAAGYVGCIEDDIRVATSPEFQGNGIAKSMITELMKKHPSAVAKVKINNTASIRLFESCGFIKKYYLLEKDNDSQSL
jgi:ribosomal protein S18 acetylase RimI-like enzyme